MRTPLYMCMIVLLVPLTFSIDLYGQKRSSEVTFYFRLKEAILDTTYLSNGGGSLTRLRRQLSSIGLIDSLTVTVSSSPEGAQKFNERLAAARAEETRRFLQQESGGLLSDSLVRLIVTDEDWEGLADAVRTSYQGSDKGKVLDIIYAEGISDATREWRLSRLNNGATWKYLKTQYCCWLRQASLIRILWNLPEVVEPQTVELTSSHSRLPSLEDRISSQTQRPHDRKAVLNFRTNLLYDALLVPNIGMEVHLGKGWALNVSWNHAWWDISARHYYYRIYGGELGVRKYFLTRNGSHPMSGHHLGLYAQAYSYDFEAGAGGQLCNVTYGGGLEYGYTLPLCDMVSLDFSVGAGYLTGEYRTYIPDEGCYVWQETRQRHWFGPTKAEVALVVSLFNGKSGKGGRR